jgi:hypothetical protein
MPSAAVGCSTAATMVARLLPVKQTLVVKPVGLRGHRVDSDSDTRVNEAGQA